MQNVLMTKDHSEAEAICCCAFFDLHSKKPFESFKMSATVRQPRWYFQTVGQPRADGHVGSFIISA